MDTKTFAYLIMGIVVLHFIVGIIWLIIKMGEKK